ncbi:isochorismatase family protein [Dongia mobilis]|nr:isochorismatase family protein [Dongia mobilis]
MLLERDVSQILVVDMQERLAPAIDGIGAVEANCRRLLEGARQFSVPVLVSEQYPAGLGHTLAALQPLIEDGEVHEKLEFSCFANAALRQALTAGGRPLTVICGIEAHVCVLQTVLEMRVAGLRVAVVADAVGSRHPDNRALARDRAARAGAEIVSTEMVLFEWLRSAADPAFKSVSRLIR